ncbi:uncharacterized protein LOC109838753 [Asparagus officinalis]|uniref:uncharacterized protein LOC109838753 n=1 Tax=Asparagus officinalis TaxID=4686 RepID=UPI00098E6BA2|nr:uncharacterized protein LOC109838753 [Asparagus officinalis]
MLYMCSHLNYSEGSIPVRYWGMPLISKKLTHLDCSPLLSKISEQFQGWQNRRNLSYAGRIQLIKSVIVGIQNYWTSNYYVLPIKVLQRIDKLCSDFLWNCMIHLVSWYDICKDKKMGGLGLYTAKDWNHAAAIKLLWMIHIKKDILWIKWVHENYIHQLDIWQVQSKGTNSWMWRQLLKVRDMALSKFGDRNNLQRAMENCHVNGKLQISAIYNALTLSATYATWSDTIWRGLHYPKHSVILWLITLSRLLTKDRLCKIGMLNENRYYSWRSCNWDQVMNWYSTNLKGKGFMKKMKRMTLSATVYWIWKERNLRIFQGKLHTPAQLVREVKTTILSKVLNENIPEHIKDKIGKICQEEVMDAEFLALRELSRKIGSPNHSRLRSI